MKKLKLFFCALLASSFLIPSEANAQSGIIMDLKTPDEGEDLMFIYNRGKYDDTFIEVFKEETPQNFTSAGMPRFAITGNKRQYYLGIGGFVKTTMSFDFDGVINSPFDFTTYNIPIPRQSGNGGLLQGTAATSSIFMHFVGLPNSDNKFSAYVNGNFIGPDNSFVFQHLFATWRGLKMGYTFSLFLDAGAVPPTIDYEGPGAATFIYNTILSYKYDINDSWTVAASLEMPQSQVTQVESAVINQRYPDIPMYVQYSWAEKASYVRVSGLLRQLRYRNDTEKKEHNLFGWGVKASGVINVMDKVNFYYQGLYGKGVSSYIQDLAGQGLDLMQAYNYDTSGRLETVKSFAVYGGIQYNITKDLFISGTYSYDRLYKPNDVETLSQDTYKHAQYIAANCFWNIRKNVQVGVEYLYGRRTDFSSTESSKSYGKANRIQCMFQVNF